MSKKILITGASGQVGSILYPYLKNSYDVINTSRTGICNSITLDISNKLEVRKALNTYSPDIIVNCASYNNVDKCESNRKEARDVIVKGLFNLIKNSKKKSKIIHISSDYVFNGEKNEYLESDFPDPINYYGRLKLEADNLLYSSNKKYIILRCNVIFSHLINNKSNFFAWVYNNLKQNKKIQVVDDQFSNPTPVDIIAKIIEFSILLDSNGVYNAGTLDSISRYDFAIKICRTFNFNESLVKRISSEDLKQVAKRPRNTFLNIDKISKDLEIDIYSVDYYLKNIRNIING